MNDTIKCPVCLNANGGTCRVLETGRGSHRYKCDVCGEYKISRSALADSFNFERAKLKPIERAAISHRLCTAAREGQPPIIDTYWLEHFMENSSLPSPAVQAANIIRYIGDEVSRSGELVPSLPVDFSAIIGAPKRELAALLATELRDRGTLRGINNVSPSGETNLVNIGLTLDGWELYEAEKRGRIAGNYGFIAMKFEDEGKPDPFELERFVRDIAKPAVKDGVDYDLVDMRDVGRAGIIDNIMRNQIRNSAFVIVDLTHDNSGAYWEAGYAEGLGKPVIYICEAGKFKEGKTHFDTNHSTTVVWSHDKAKDFSQDLVATLRRSLNLFPGS